MYYTGKYFKENLPEWKKKKDPLYLRYFCRPISFYLAAIAANLRISANTVSYMSAIIAVVGCLCFLLQGKSGPIVGAVLFNIWLIFDCIDGNLARSVKKQPFGEFADAMSSYILVGLMNTFMAVSVYFNGGLIVKSGHIWIVIVGALASEADTLMRLIYQKYKNTENELLQQGILKEVKDIRTNHNNVNSFRVRVEMELGIAGLLPVAILFGSIFGFLDLIVIYSFIYYGCSCIVTVFMYVTKACKECRKWEENNREK